MSSIADQLQNVRQRIQKATKSAGREAGTVHLLAVSKTQAAERLYEAMQAGQLAFGENYLQEALDKQGMLKGLCDDDAWAQVVWHFIGPLQSNKTRPVAEHFQWVHSIDRLKIARRLNDQRPSHMPPLNICLQVNVDDEASKSGVTLAELSTLAGEVAAMPRLTLRGLMAIPSAQVSAARTAESFARMHAAWRQLRQDHASIDTLSMGMSADIEAAIAHGSTMVRVGTAIFGARQT